MRIIKENLQELVLEKKKRLDSFLLFFSLVYAGIPLIVITIFFADLGVININCQRIEPTQVNCKLNRSGFFGFVKRESQVLKDVTQANFEQILGEDDDGDTTIDNPVIIEVKQGQNFIIEEAIPIRNVTGNEQHLTLIASKINNFLNTNQPSFVLNIDNRWRWREIFMSEFFWFGSIIWIFILV